MKNSTIKHIDIPNTSIISNSDIFPDILLVDSNPATIQSTETVKVNSQIKKIVSNKTFYLHKYSTEIDKNIYDFIDSEFMDILNKIEDNNTVKYFNRGFLKNFKKRDPNLIYELIKDNSWIITSDVICDELSKLHNYKLINSNVSGFIKSGSIDSTNVYTSDKIDEGDIFMGNSDSIGFIIDRNIRTDDENIYFEFLFCNNYIRKVVLI